MYLKIILVASLLINILFMLATGYIIYNRGGVSYLEGRLKSAIYDEKIDTPSYINRKTTFEHLPITKDSIVFLGDSLTHGNEWQEVFREGTVLNRGISGDRSDGVLRRMDQIIKLKPSKLFIMVGVNDLNDGITLDNIVKNYRGILSILETELPSTQIYLQSVLPINETLFKSRFTNMDIDSLNSKLEKVANDYNAMYIDLHSLFEENTDQLDSRYTTDGLHVNGDGYLVWIDAIKEFVN